MDTELFLLINQHYNPFFDSFFYLISQKTVWIPLYVALVYAVWRNYSWRGALMILVMFGIGMLFTDWANSHYLRPWIGRLRPSNPESPLADVVHLVNDRRGGGYGFPSCHSANIWLLTFVVMHWLRNHFVTVSMVVVSVLVCYSRVYLAFHYPGDILGGFVLASVVAFVLAYLHKRYMLFKPVKEPRHVWVPVSVVVLTMLIFLVLSLK